MTRRSRRASSAPRRVGSDEGLTSTRSVTPTEPTPDTEAADPSSSPTVVEQTKDDTDEGWGERGEDDASARWLRENRPPHWS